MMSSSEIADFYTNKSVFITGGTGFLGKVLVEKLLRSCTEVKHIYLLIRCKRGQNVKTRLKEMVGTKIFDKFNEWNPNPINKIVAIEGDITVPGLGISDQDLETITREVSVVFHSAATVRFDEPLKTAVNYNVLGTKRVIQLCHKLNKLQALIYVSTAYSNSNRYEINETVYPSPVSPKSIIDLCEWMSDEMLVKITPDIIGDHPNTYTFTKCLAENLLKDECEGIPLAIVRPSIVCAARNEPLPGWVDNISGVTGLLLAYGTGILRHLFVKTKFRADFIPVDTVINLLITLAWFTSQSSGGVEVYNCTSGSLKPITLKKVFSMPEKIKSTNYPWSNIYRYPYMICTDSKLIYKISILFNHLIPAHILDVLLYLIGRKGDLVNIYGKLHRALEKFEFFLTREFKFSNKKSMVLYELISQTDKTTFNFEIGSLDWTEYFTDYWLGVRQYIVKESNETLPRARQNLRKVYMREICFVLVIAFITIGAISIIFYKLH